MRRKNGAPRGFSTRTAHQSEGWYSPGLVWWRVCSQSCSSGKPQGASVCGCMATWPRECVLHAFLYFGSFWRCFFFVGLSLSLIETANVCRQSLNCTSWTSQGAAKSVDCPRPAQYYVPGIWIRFLTRCWSCTNPQMEKQALSFFL